MQKRQRPTLEYKPTREKTNFNIRTLSFVENLLTTAKFFISKSYFLSQHLTM